MRLVETLEVLHMFQDPEVRSKNLAKLAPNMPDHGIFLKDGRFEIRSLPPQKPTVTRTPTLYGLSPVSMDSISQSFL